MLQVKIPVAYKIDTLDVPMSESLVFILADGMDCDIAAFPGAIRSILIETDKRALSFSAR